MKLFDQIIKFHEYQNNCWNNRLNYSNCEFYLSHDNNNK